MKPGNMIVRAAREGIKVPHEEMPRRYIGDDPVEVPRSNYYLRQVDHGDLEEVDPAELEPELATGTAAIASSSTRGPRAAAPAINTSKDGGAPSATVGKAE